MTFEEYQDEMRRTFKPGRLAGHVLGLAGESGEVADMVKKRLYHDVPYSPHDMLKELGDCLWYVTAVAEEHGFSLDTVARENVDKLRKRYPTGFVTGGGIRNV